MLREKQKHALKCMINLNSQSAKGSSSTSEPAWKLLVYDKTGQDIVSPLLSVKELRDLGVTLHMYIHSERDSIPDVPVIYFVLPTEENIARICQDFKNQLYDNFYLNFITPISRQKLEDLATTALQANVATSISRIYDQYSYFISLEDDMFSLREHDQDSVSYYAINRGDVSENEMESIMNSIVDGLLSVFVTLGVVPVIRCPKGNAAEMVAQKLCRKIKQNIQDVKNNLFVSGDNYQQEETMPRPRPLLIVLDRNMDMTTPLHHTWTYQALAHDVLNLKLNQLKIDEADPEEQQSKRKAKDKSNKLYDLNANDKFWQLHKGSPFPQVAEAVQEELESYRSSEDEVKRLKAAMGLEASDEAVVMLNDATAKLNTAVSSLPELLEKKKYIDMHTTIATSMLDQIKNRKLDVFFEVEEKIMSRSMLDKSPVELIVDPNAGSPSDKLRLFLIHFLCNPSLSPEELKQFEKALLEAGCDLNILQYMKRWKTFSKVTLSNASTHYGGGTKTVNMFSKLMSQGSQFVMEGVKNLVVKKHILPMTRIADSLMDNKALQECDDFLYLDPKVKKADSGMPSNLPPFQDAVVFVVGGGNYIEYQNLIDFCKMKSAKTLPKRIIYGCTNVMNADQFLRQLSKLGVEL
ncbi:Sec1 family domain-containing protein 1 [Halotydeus destructor]|nr:Sec1 family domain-containing protein 1 [Halotydeus destructor]